MSSTSYPKFIITNGPQVKHLAFLRARHESANALATLLPVFSDVTKASTFRDRLFPDYKVAGIMDPSGFLDMLRNVQEYALAVAFDPEEIWEHAQTVTLGELIPQIEAEQ